MKILKLTFFDKSKVAVNFDYVKSIEEQSNKTCVILLENEKESIHVCESLDFILESLKEPKS